MRVNLPVTESRFPFPPGQTLVSTTDTQGRILYVNPSFVTVSGYAKDELLGQPHNLIRHPDMPEEAFRDMWETIAAGLPWSAPVKNRRKDGSHYWVMANVTPLMEADRPVGFMSVRTEASEEQIQAAEALYRTMRAERQANRRVHTLARGRLVLLTPSARLSRWLRPGPRMRAGAAGAALSAGSAALAGGGWLLSAGLGLVGAGLGATLLAGASLGPLAQLLRLANRMAAGDLTQRVDTGGEGVHAQLAQALNQLNVNLRSIVRDARGEVQHMRDATREIAAGNQDLSARTESQASSLEETASSMEEITGTVRQSAESAGQASELAGRAVEVTRRGSDAVAQVAETMHGISDASRRIGEIIQVIDGIAFQTNILALNAAVEAARAGEEGRGFAVVAAEVRALARRTSGAAREVKQLIEDSSAKVQAGTRQTEAARDTMTQALQTVQEVGHVIAEISTGAREQLTGISQVNEAVAQMDTITQQNAALVEQIAASAAQLQTQAVGVSEAVQVFRLEAGETRAGQDAVALRRAAKGTRQVAETAAA